MVKQDTVALILRLMGVYLLAMYIPSIPLRMDIDPSGSRIVLYPTLIQLLLVVGMSLVLILASKSLARWLTPAADDSTSSLSLSLSDIQAVAFSVIGVLVAVRATYGVSRMFTDPRFKPLSDIGYVLQLAFGLVLFFQSRGLAGFWQRLQKTRPMTEGNA